MTTVDVRIERLGSGDRLYLHNGMWGAGDPRPARIRPSLPGWQDLQQQVEHSGDQRDHDRCRRGQALDSIEDQDWQHSGDSTDQERVTAFRDRLADSAEYEIHALEV